ncbi:MAG: RHS repeat-associated core domain-containing protein [Saprospiraceae bacterium]
MHQKSNYLNLPEEITKGRSGNEYRDEALNSVFHAEGRAFKDKDKDKWQYEYFIKDHPDPAGAGQALCNTHLSVADLNRDGCIDPLSDLSEVLQENHYYPFGLNMDGPWVTPYQEDQDGNPLLDDDENPIVDQDKLNRYQYNSKELTTDLGLNWNDYGMRWYDPAIGRWNAVDPLAESMSSWSPYNYTYSNPMRFIDPNGMAPFGDYYGSSGQYLGSDSKNDDKVHVIVDQQETKNVKKALRTAKKNKVDQSFVLDNANLSSTVTINKDIVNGVVASTEAMAKETSKGAGDAGLHEEGGHSENGKIVNWEAGPKKDGKRGKASISLFNGVDKPDPSNLEAVWHVHTNKKTPTGNVVDGKEEYRVGGSGPSTSGRNNDLDGHKRLQAVGFKGVSIVSGGSSNTVHFYNGTGSYFSTSFSRFKKMGKNR